MLQRTYKTQVAAGASAVDVFLNSELSNSGAGGMLIMWGRQDATGAGTLEVDVHIGGVQVVEGQGLTKNDATNPNRRDDIVFGPIAVPPNQKIKVDLTETGGADAATPNLILELS